jgi:glycogen debranching enzyme
LARWLDRGRAGLASRFDPQTGLCADYDVRAAEDIRLRTFASFAPLFARTPALGQRAAQMRLLDSADFCGHPHLRWPLLPSTSPAEPAFEPLNYWRGPVWPVISWLLWQSLHLLGYSARANAIRSDSLSQLVVAGEFGEYFEPFTGKQLGSTQQSWTAAVTLDWLASEHDGEGAGAPAGT